MTDDRATARRAGDQSPQAPDEAVPFGAAARPALTPEDIRRLTLYKWRYALESTGFTGEQVGRLLFLKWLYARRVVRG